VPIAESLVAFRRKVPEHACVGAVLDGYDPSFLLFGPRRQHRVVYLSVNDALVGANRAGVRYVVITTGVNGWAADTFRQAGWTVEPLGSGYWVLATAPNAGDGTC